MDTIFMNSENSKTSEHNVLVLKLTDKLDLRRGQKPVALSNLSIYYTWKNVKSSYNINKDDYKDKLLLSKEREIFKDIYNKRLNEIEEMSNEIDYNDLNYVVLSTDMEYKFSIEKDPVNLLNAIKKGEMSLEEAKNRQKEYLYYLNIIRKGNKNPIQRKTLSNIENHFNARNNVIKFIEDYSSMIFEAKRLVKEEQEGKDLKY